ncbi:MAG TPA: sigma 54-interacting transcriptional regulator [Lacipirellulaceae bacterium]|nr:sigma 54-interacting transcriptional regulator [Lacipirellulaceae bacterium]
MTVTSRGLYAFLTILTGNRAGTNFPLDARRQTLIGRGTDCHISVPDPLCSRVHATLTFTPDGWVIRDADSRNGTQVNGQKIDEATVVDGNTIRVGAHEFEFHESEEPPTAKGDDPQLMQTIVQDLPIAVQETHEQSLVGLPSAEQVKELMLLYQLCIKLLGCGEPSRVVEIALELLRKRTGASVVGFLSVDDEGGLQPKVVIPKDAAGRVTLNQSLTELVSRQGHAVWVANQSSKDGHPGGTRALGHFADAVCAPLVRRNLDGERATVGAIHVYLEDGRFRQSDFDFIISVANIMAIALVRARALTTLQSDYQRLVEKSPGHDELIGNCAPMRDLKSKINRVARAPGCVLVRGESGSGKELVARAIHRASPRTDRHMVSVNCAAIPHDLMESQLFGHKAGSFTGADRDHTGFFQQADLGTLFLDEVGELTLEGQAKLLRILEGHPFLPVGATDEVKVDVRVIAATNQNLQKFVREKRFREDLYYRLSVFELHVPPLRERGEDIALLVDYFLDQFGRLHGRPNMKLSDSARAKLLAYHWPGNVRQLRNVLDSAVVLAEEDSIRPHDLALRDSGGGELETLRIDEWERRLITEALTRTGDNVPEAAKLLGIGRATLYRKIEQYHIER